MILSSKLKEAKEKKTHTNLLPNSQSTFKETAVMADTNNKKNFGQIEKLLFYVREMSRLNIGTEKLPLSFPWVSSVP